MKRHDRDIAWVDFVRGVADPEVERQMRQRMTSGSETDKKDIDLWQKVATLGRRDIEHKIPDEHDITRIVKAMGPMMLPTKAPSLRRLVAELAFGNQLAPVGVRGGRSGQPTFGLSSRGLYVRHQGRALVPGRFPARWSSGVAGGKALRSSLRTSRCSFSTRMSSSRPWCVTTTANFTPLSYPTHPRSCSS